VAAAFRAAEWPFAWYRAASPIDLSVNDAAAASDDGGRAVCDLLDAMAADSTASPPTGFSARLKRAGLLAAMAVVAVNIWTGSPLLALWIGSRVQGEGGVKMGAVFVVVASMVVTSILLIRALGALGRAHDRLAGLPPPARRQQPWMRSLSGERVSSERRRARVSALDVVLVVTVLLAAGAFEVWFFFFSGSSI
jgi:hypothetical protein